MKRARELGNYRVLVEALELGLTPGELEERHGLLASFVREHAGGARYANEVVELVHGSEGVFVSFPGLPNAAYAWLGEARGVFLTPVEAQIGLWEAMERAEAGEGDLVVLYEPGYADDDEKIFMAYTYEGDRYQRGWPRTKLPLFLWLAAPEEHLLMVRTPHDGYLAFRLERGMPMLRGVTS
jgi:hypothetical protein